MTDRPAGPGTTAERPIAPLPVHRRSVEADRTGRAGTAAPPRATDHPRLRVVARGAAAFAGAYIVLVAVWVVVGELIERGPFGGVRSFDERVAEGAVGWRTPGRDDVAFYVAQGADTFIKIGVTAALVVLFWLLWRRWHEVVVVAGSLVLEAAVFMTVTTIVQRPRPDVPQLEASPVSSSFPSGHTAAAAVYTALAVVVCWHTRNRLARAAAVAVTALAPVLIGTARVYQGMHHVTDVAFGALLGLVTVAVVVAIVGRPGPVAHRAEGRGRRAERRGLRTGGHGRIGDAGAGGFAGAVAGQQGEGHERWNAPTNGRQT